MDERLVNIIDSAMADHRNNIDGAKDNHCLEGYISIRIHDASYRYDPYPNGKSKDELITLASDRWFLLMDARNKLFYEHEKNVKSSFGITMDSHRELDPKCAICKFLTSDPERKS